VYVLSARLSLELSECKDVPTLCDILAQGLIGLIRILIPTSCNFFSGNPSLKTSMLSVLGLERSQTIVIDPSAWCGAARTLCAGDVETPFLGGETP
jgi:hypothetical protein